MSRKKTQFSPALKATTAKRKKVKENEEGVREEERERERRKSERKRLLSVILICMVDENVRSFRHENEEKIINTREEEEFILRSILSTCSSYLLLRAAWLLARKGTHMRAICAYKQHAMPACLSF